tara:strand:+ start:551 stop:757 length:207 start_codon:yes stop_codon:yes gene_type:complete
MSVEIAVLVSALCFFLIAPCLIILNTIRLNAERGAVVIDYMDYVKQKAKGDEVDQLIAKHLDIEEVAA